jgi:hypothetical protein
MRRRLEDARELPSKLLFYKDLSPRTEGFDVRRDGFALCIEGVRCASCSLHCASWFATRAGVVYQLRSEDFYQRSRDYEPLIYMALMQKCKSYMTFASSKSSDAKVC